MTGVQTCALPIYIDGVERTETWLSLEEAIERQVWVNDSDYNKDSNRQKKEVKKKSAK